MNVIHKRVRVCACVSVGQGRGGGDRVLAREGMDPKPKTQNPKPKTQNPKPYGCESWPVMVMVMVWSRRCVFGVSSGGEKNGSDGMRKFCLTHTEAYCVRSKDAMARFICSLVSSRLVSLLT